MNIYKIFLLLLLIFNTSVIAKNIPSQNSDLNESSLIVMQTQINNQENQIEELILGFKEIFSLV